jgi:predicted small secreted protein
MKTSLSRILVLVSAMTLLTACGTVQVGNDFDLQKFTKNVQHGVTTMSEVRSWLGSPVSTGVAVDSSGTQKEKWTYYYGSGQVSDMNQAHLKYLELEFNKDGRLVSYNWSQ